MGNTAGTARGTITVENGGLLTASGFTFNGTNNLVNIRNGTVLLTGNQTNLVKGYIASNWIKAYGGTGTMLMDYNTKNAGKTTLTALAPGEIAVPNVTGQARTAAESTITLAGLTVGSITLSTSSSVASNSVISQNPAAGVVADQGDPVHLLLSVGGRDATFNDTTGDGLWSTAANWSGSILPGTGATNKFSAGKTATINYAAPNIEVLKLGDNNSNAGLIIDGGSLTVVGTSWDSFSYNRGSTTLIKNNGSLTFSGTGVVFAGYTNSLAGEKVLVTLESGTLTMGGEFRLGSVYGPANGSTVHVAVNGGVLTAGGLFINSNGNCSMDIRKGTVLISGDKTATITGYINGRLMTAYSGTGTISMDYNQSNAGYTTLRAIAPEEGYDAWAAAYTSSIGSGETDYDGDSVNNFYEYALNGDPTDPVNNGVNPTLVHTGNGFEYLHCQRSDDPGLIYTVEIRTNLLSGVWTPAAFTAETNTTGGAYDEVTHRITTNDPQTFIRLKITD